MNKELTLLMLFCTTAHLVATTVVAVFAQKRVQYLSLAWVLGIMTVGLATCLGLFYGYENAIEVGLIHPSIVLPMAASSYIETIYPLSLIMPGFLQWRRAVKYALPVLIVIIGYFTGVLIVGHAPVLKSFADIRENFWLVPDVFIRLVALGLAIYYVIGIVRLPKRMLRHNIEIPTYLKGYCTWLGITYMLFIFLSIDFSWWLLYTVLILITFNNMCFMLQSLEGIAESLPRPKIQDMRDVALSDVIDGDFNEANLQRFKRVEHYMQNTRDWMNIGFTREMLCEGIGFNRHLLLQCLRSQGYNNVHDYIMTYRVEQLRRIIVSHRVDTLSQACESVGFATLVTARTAYKKFLSRDLDVDWSA